MLDRRLIVFVRAPRPGAVKTRLAASIGAEQAAVAYRRVVEKLLEQLGPIQGVELHFAPSDAEPEITSWVRHGWSARAQSEGRLGQRMHAAFVNAFQEGADRVALIGSDCPSLTAEDVALAWDALEESDLVLGPALDGGYWLIALHRPQPALFEDIAWSTSTVLAQTTARAQAAGLKVKLLRPLCDIDTAEDWRQFLLAEGGQS